MTTTTTKGSRNGNALKPVQSVPKRTTASRFVLDMFCIRTPLDSECAGFKDVQAIQSNIAQGAPRLVKALSKAQRQSPLAVTVQHTVGKDSEKLIRVACTVSISGTVIEGGTDDYAVFELELSSTAVPNAELTKITVRVSRDHPTEPTRYTVQIQGNATTLLTWQNTRPMHPLLGSLRYDLALQFSWPYLVVLAVCAKADPKFVPSKTLTSIFLSGMAIVQNGQFAFAVKVPESRKQAALGLLAETYVARRVMPVGSKVASYSIGKWLNVKARYHERKTIKLH